MRRADRLFQIVQYLRGGRLVTAAQLSDWLEVSERTIYRDMADLMASGVPIDGEAGVGYLMRAGFDLPPMMFTRDEITALVAGARLIRAWGGAAMAGAAEEALVKIEAVLPPEARAMAEEIQIHAFRPSNMRDEDRHRLDLLDRAIKARTRLVLDYSDAEGRESERPVRPLGLWFWGKVWTLVAWCELRDDFRIFRIDRIQNQRTDGRFAHETGKRLSDFYAVEQARGGQ